MSVDNIVARQIERRAQIAEAMKRCRGDKTVLKRLRAELSAVERAGHFA